MDEFIFGFYWKGRPQTLRQYTDSVKGFLLSLKKTHPVFRSMLWESEDGQSKPVQLLPDLSNVDMLAYRHAGGGSQVYNVAHDDGSPKWGSIGYRGYHMTFSNGESLEDGNVTVSILAGKSSDMFNMVTIQFPTPANLNFMYHDFYSYDFARNIFIDAIQFWQPEKARVFSYDFGEAVEDGKPHIAGWLIYLADRRVLDLRDDEALKDFQVEALATKSDQGSLISMENNIIFSLDAREVAKVKRLRAKLIAENLI
ncbi:MAG TPA: hypothetical protein VGP06_03895 [Janthinobacterium sp.]|nr:hypothetical protein [Janthinobacterium sp.]